MKHQKNISQQEINTGLIAKVEVALEKRKKLLLGLSLILSAVFGLLLFDGRLSFMTDDAEYILRTYHFVYNGSYPAYQGPLYPLTLSVFMAIFGVNVLVFKIFSLFCIVGSVYFFYKAFEGKVPYLALFTTLLALSINSYVLYYGSFTFNEAFVLFLEALSFYFLTKHLAHIGNGLKFSENWKSWLTFGLFLFLLSITKNILILAVGAFVLYFLLRKEWLNAVYTIGVFLVFKIPYEIITRLAFKTGTTEQIDQILRKDFYDPTKGYEDISGFIDRFFFNFNKFFSVHFYKLIGLRSEDLQPGQPGTPLETNTLLAFLFVIILIAAGWYLYKKKERFAFAALLFSFCVMMVICVAVQQMWAEQDRLILPFIPYMMIAFLTALVVWASNTKNDLLKFATVGLCGILVIVQLPKTMGKVQENGRLMSRNFKNNATAGFPPQIIDFISMTNWIGENLPENVKVATGKPSEAFVYAKSNKFVRINRVTSQKADEILAQLKERGATHLLLHPAIGFNRNEITAFQIFNEQQPQRLQLLQQIGQGEGGTYLFEIKY